MSILEQFRLAEEREDFQVVGNNIAEGSEFKKTNLWILIFAIFIASLGLNVNSTAVIIGAMLVSPLMGPIMGLGFGMAVNDLSLLRRSLSSYLFAAVVGLATSTFYFFLSPINDAHSEILARTSPNIYDVLIALFGGFAGMVATSSRMKGNVIPGVAIATALMPPLCTAGYGLATLQFQFFFGAFYLFLINTVFIALATLLTTRLLKFPYKHLPRKEDDLRAKRIVWLITLITLLPSIYFGYDAVRRNKFLQRANRFIEHETAIPNDFVLKKVIDPRGRTITLTYGGRVIDKEEIDSLRSRMSKYGLGDAHLEVRQGFAYLEQTENDNGSAQITMMMSELQRQIDSLRGQVDNMTYADHLGKQMLQELEVQFPKVRNVLLQRLADKPDSNTGNRWMAIIQMTGTWSQKDRSAIEKWMNERMKGEYVKIYFE